MKLITLDERRRDLLRKLHSNSRLAAAADAHDDDRRRRSQRRYAAHPTPVAVLALWIRRMPTAVTRRAGSIPSPRSTPSNKDPVCRPRLSKSTEIVVRGGTI